MAARLIPVILVAVALSGVGPDLPKPAAEAWHEALAAHAAGDHDRALARFLAARDLAPEVLALDDEGLLDGVERHLRDRTVADPADADAWLSLADVLRLRGRWAEAGRTYDRVTTLAVPSSVSDRALQASRAVTAELQAQQAAVARMPVRPVGDPARRAEVERLERQVDELVRANAELRRQIDERHGQAVDARIAARKLEKLIAERRQEYREYRENYQLYYRNLPAGGR